MRRRGLWYLVLVRVKCGSTSRQRKEQQRRDKSQGRSKSRGKCTCFYCGKPKHYQKDCRHLKDKGTSKDVKPKKISEEKGTSAIATSEEEILFICEQASTNLASEECTWVINSGAPFHITPSRECFSTYTTMDYGGVKMQDSGECRILDIGNVCLTTSTDCRLILKDVWHMPNFRLNLILTGRMDEEGYSGSFRNGKWKFY